MGHVYFTRVLLIIANVSTISALLCLSCKEVNDVEDCLTLQDCALNQTCYANRFIGSSGKPVYNLGCIDTVGCAQSPSGKRDYINKDLTTFYEENGSSLKRSGPSCLQCCNNKNGCNKELCGSNPSNNLRCMICRDVLETKYCNKLTTCGHDQFCFVQRTVNSLSMTHRYEMDCMGFQQCDALLKASRQDCAVCCNNTDFCNYDACNNWTASSTSLASTKQTTTVTTPTMTSRATVMSQSTSTSGPNSFGAQVVLDGPNSSAYKSRVELKCISVPTAQRYIWKYNHSTTLPLGVNIEKEIVISPLAGEDKLIIAELDESKVGLYSCEAVINGQSLEKSHFIAITKEKPTAQIVKTFIPPYFALVCTTTGYPPPQIGWAFVQAGPKTGSVDLPVDADVTRKGLVSIVAVDHYKSTTHDGSWYCAATNSLGNVVSEVDIP